MAETPIQIDGSEAAAETVDSSTVATLEELPVGRRCNKCHATVFVVKGHCPKCGCFLVDNQDALTHGKHSRKALRRRREEIYAEVCARYPQAADSVRRPYSAAVALSERATECIESSAHTLASERQQRNGKVFMDTLDRIARLGVVLESTRPAGGASDTRVPFSVRYFNDIDNEDSTHPQLPGVTDRTIEAIDPGFGRNLIIDRWTSTEAGDSDAIDGEVMTQPRQERGDVTQVTPSGGAIRVWGDGTVLMFSGVSGMRVGQEVRFERKSTRAVAVEAV